MDGSVFLKGDSLSRAMSSISKSTSDKLWASPCSSPPSFTKSFGHPEIVNPWSDLRAPNLLYGHQLNPMQNGEDLKLFQAKQSFHRKRHYVGTIAYQQLTILPPHRSGLPKSFYFHRFLPIIPRAAASPQVLQVE
ncbi:hypothetical protein OPV22_016108 [Ensete ventricosum]|uniref:Growth-regulating factor n=1 Tax=Ensete ventricosum TaxID=4639 RepID=A0AAV8QT10_ENSVE|nr:hypothetical protein OPV22_016108 [Ensete ventricosum]